MKKLTIAAAITTSLTACTDVRLLPNGGIQSTRLDGSVCTSVGTATYCKSAAEVAMEKQLQAVAAKRVADAAARNQQAQADAAAAQAQAEATRQAELAWENSPEGKAELAHREAKQAAAQLKRAADQAARNIALCKGSIERAQQGLEHEHEVEVVSGIIDMDTRYRWGNEIVNCKHEIAQSWKVYKANGGTAKSIADIN